MEFIEIKDAYLAVKKVAANLFDTDKYAQAFQVMFGADAEAPTLVDEASPFPTYSAGGAYYDEDGNKLTVKDAWINAASGSTDASLVAAVSGKKIRVLHALWLCGNAATNLTFNSKGAGAGTAISPTWPNGANSGMNTVSNPWRLFQTNASEALTVTTSASGVSTAVYVLYVEKP